MFYQESVDIDLTKYLFLQLEVIKPTVSQVNWYEHLMESREYRFPSPQLIYMFISQK